MQDKILKVVGRKWMTPKEVSLKLKTEIGGTRKKLNQLAKFKLIQKKPCKVLINDQRFKMNKYRRGR